MEIPPLPLPKPRSLMVFGILNLAVGILGIWGLVQTAMLNVLADNPTANMTREIFAANPGFALFTNVTTILSVIATLAVIASAIGLMKGKAWARPLAIGWAIYQLISAPISIWAARVYMHPMLIKMTTEQAGDASMAKVMDMVMLGTVVISGVLWVAYCLLEIIFLSRGKIKGYLLQQRASRA